MIYSHEIKTALCSLIAFHHDGVIFKAMTKNTWIQIELLVPVPAIDLVCDELTTLGCTGTLVEKRELDTFIVPEDDLNPDTDVCLQAYFPAELNLQELHFQIENIFAELRPLFPNRTFTLGKDSQVSQEDWAEGWKQHFPLQRFGKRLVISPSWEEYTPSQEEIVLTLDPGMAFGTGSHGTTLLCLEAIVEIFDRDEALNSLLDVGTGSGILAMGAAALGTPKVVACDIDPLACEVATENCRINGLAEKVEITTDLLDKIPGQYDVVVANILAEENLRLADQLIARMAPRGYLFVSGILEEKENLVYEGFSQQPIRYLKTTRRDGWVCLVWQKS